MPKKIANKKQLQTPEKNTEEDTIKTVKVLGKSSYKNSKQKKKIQQKKLAEVKKVVSKDRQLKVKIKHLEKELIRISKAIADGKTDKKISEEKLAIEQKLLKLKVANNKVIKRTKPKVENFDT